MEIHHFSSRTKRRLARLIVFAMGLMLIALSTFAARADKAAVTDPCGVFPPVFPAGVPDTFLTFLEHRVPEDLTTATAYYAAVDPFNRRTTLNDWLVLNGFIDNPGDLTAGPAGDALVQRDAFAMYVNDVDLGVTRRFYSLTDSAGNVAIYTENYPCLADAKLRQNLLATVGMEYRVADDGSNPTKKFTTFYAYGPDNARILAINLDGRGEKAIPGNCMICHGGNPLALNADGTYPNHGDVGASFLPWDISAFIFDTDPTLTRAALEADIKKLNLAAYATYDKRVKYDQVGRYYRPNAMVELIQGWYGGANFPSPTFNENFTPRGWLPPLAPAGAEAVYHEVVVTSCRSCHVSRERSLDFAGHRAFMVFENAHRRLVYNYEPDADPTTPDDAGIMPLALQTFNNFWASGAPNTLLNWLNTH